MRCQVAAFCAAIMALPVACCRLYPSVGMRGDLLVTYVDDADAFIDTPVVDVDDVAAAQCKDGIDALAFLSAWPPEMTLVSRVFALRVSSAVVVPGLLGAFVAVSSINPPLSVNRSSRAEPVQDPR
jgi:hypothetical protein